MGETKLIMSTLSVMTQNVEQLLAICNAHTAAIELLKATLEIQSQRISALEEASRREAHIAGPECR